jgi:hypothetical protein
MRQARIPKVRTIAAMVAAALLAGTAAAVTEPPLRYQWHVGDWLVYERRAVTTPLDADAPRQVTTEQVQLWCLERRGGGYLMQLDVLDAAGGPASVLRGVLVELDPQGLRQWPAVMRGRVLPAAAALEVVPAHRSALEPGPTWLTPPDHYGRQWRCTQGAPDAARGGAVRIAFETVDTTGGDALLGRSAAGAFWFDATAGHVMAVEYEERDTQAGTRTQVTVTRRHVVRNDERWCALRVAEARRYLAALEREDRLLATLSADPARAAPLLAELEQLWVETRRDLARDPRSPVNLLVTARHRRLVEDVPRWRTRAARLAGWLNRPARAWTLQTADGRTLAREAFGGRRTVECFWSVASEESVRMLPRLRALARPEEAPPVLALNVDADPTAARRAAQGDDRVRHVLAEPLRRAEPLDELPVVRLLDAEGVVRRVWFGWQPALELDAAP